MISPFAGHMVQTNQNLPPRFLLVLRDAMLDEPGISILYPPSVRQPSAPRQANLRAPAPRDPEARRHLLPASTKVPQRRITSA